MTDKEKFRKEVEKLKSNLIYGACSSQIAMEKRCKEEAYNEVLAILDTMQEEPVSEDLEEAGKQYLERSNPDRVHQITNAFKAGAEWKEEIMMAKAINTEVSLTMSVPSICISLPLGVNVGDKVKVIVIKVD